VEVDVPGDLALIGTKARNLREIKRVSFIDGPAKLREWADQLEKIPTVKTVVLVIGYPTGHVAVRGAGERSSCLELAGWLSRGVTALNERLNMDDAGYAGPIPPSAA